MRTNWLANFFTWVYEVVSEADKPISLVAAVILPFIAPLLPALITAGSLQRFMQFDESWTWIAVVSFELIGFLGMIAVVGAGMRLANNTDPNKTDALKWNRNFYLIAYVIYLATLISSNIILEIVNGVSTAHVIVIFCLTVGLSIAAGILNASRIYDRNEKEDQYNLRREKREERLERFRIKTEVSGKNLESFKKVSSEEESFQEGSRKSPDWRKVRLQLSKEDLEKLASLSPEQMRQYATETGFTYKTISNWKNSARNELGMSKD
jgi:hypothetical protein